MTPAHRPFMYVLAVAFLLPAATVRAQEPSASAQSTQARYGEMTQELGRLRVSMQLTDSKSHVTYPGVRKALTITPEAGAPVFRAETGSDGTVEISLRPGVYVVESVGSVRFFRRTYQWHTTVVIEAGAVTVVELTERNGQSAPIPSAARGPFLAPFVQYGAPLRLAAGLSVLIPVGATTRDEGVLGALGIELEASGGQGGWRVAAGAGAAALPFWWADVLLTATRTTADPRGAFPEATYVGLEVGAALIFPIEWVYLPFGVMIKPSFGFAHRLDAPADSKRNMYTWSAGARFLVINF